MDTERDIFVDHPGEDGSWGWIVVLATFFIHLICDGLMFCFGIFFAQFLEYFRASTGAAAMVQSVFIGMNFVTGPVASGLINKYGCRPVSFAGCIIGCAGLLFAQIVPNIDYLVLTIGIIAGFGFGLMYLPTVVSLAQHFHSRYATAMGLSLAGSGIGCLIFAPLTDWLISKYGSWKGALLIETGIVLNCLVLSFSYLPQKVIKQRNESTRESDPDRLVATASIPNLPTAVRQEHALNAKGQPSSTVAVSVMKAELCRTPNCLGFLDTLRQSIDLSLLTNYVFLIFSIGTFLQYFGLNVPTVYLYHLSAERGVAFGTEASLFFGIMGFSNTWGKILIGIIADRAPLKTVYIYSILLIINGISTMMIPLIKKYYQMTIYCVIFGVTWGSCFSLAPVVLVQHLGVPKLCNSYGLTLLVIGFATTIGTPVPGYLFDVTGSYSLGLYISGTLIILGSLLLLWIPTVERKCLQ